MRLDPVERAAEHHRVRLADEVGIAAGGLGDHGGDGAGGRHRTLSRRPGDVGVGRDESCAAQDQADGLGDRGERIRPGLAEDDEVGVDVGERVAQFM